MFQVVDVDELFIVIEVPFGEFEVVKSESASVWGSWVGGSCPRADS